MTGLRDDSMAVTAPRRADAGTVRLTSRDITGLVLAAEHYAAPYDLLASALDVRPDRLRGIVARWRAGGYAMSGRLGPGPWAWLTPAGMTAVGLRYQAGPPRLARLAHCRAVLAARLWLASGQAYRAAGAWWQSERRLRAGTRQVPARHVADAEIHWPSLPDSPYAGQVWSVEVELTAKTADRTTRIMSGLLAAGYSQIVYLTAPAARPVVTRCADSLPPEDRARVAIRDLPPSAGLPGPVP
jgi:hypothetical protein